jgi:hypothetical protein
MPLPQLKQQPTFHNVVSHPDDTPVLQTSNFSYTPWFSTHEADKNIAPEKLMERAIEARDWLKSKAGGSPFGFVYEDGTYEMYPSNECLGLINNPKRFMQDKPVAYFIGAGGSHANPATEKGVDWMINRSPFAKVFVTKDAKELITKGVIMNTEHSVGITVCALRSLYTMLGGMSSVWAQWAELVPEDVAWPFAHYLKFAGSNTVTFSDTYSWSGTMSKNIGIDGIKRFATHDYSMQDKIPMRVKPYRYHDFSHQWKTHDKAAYIPFKPDVTTKHVTKKNSISGTFITSKHDNAVGGSDMKEIAANLLNYIGYPYEQAAA